MAKQVLPTNFMDDILNESMNGKRRWIITQNDDGTYTFEDATTYDQLGNTFGQAQVNEMNKAINESVDQARVIDDYKTLAAVNQNGFVPGAKPVAQLISDLGGCSLEQENGNFYIVGADSVRKKLGNDDVRMFTLSFPNADGTCTLDNLDLTGDPNFISVSTANNVWVDAVYNAIAPCGQTGLVSDKVKMCAYAISQKIEYRDKSDVFPVCTKDVVTINYSPFKSGVGDKTTRVVIAHF